MTAALVLIGWFGTGIGVAAMSSHESAARWAWAPMAAAFGPLWYLIARDQRPLEPRPATVDRS